MSLVAELSYTPGPSLWIRTNTPTARVPVSSAAPESRNGSITRTVVTDSAASPAWTVCVAPTLAPVGVGGFLRVVAARVTGLVTVVTVEDAVCDELEPQAAAKQPAVTITVADRARASASTLASLAGHLSADAAQQAPPGRVRPGGRHLIATDGGREARIVNR